ncbi:hypothetical protein P280DRAFT_473719 [Massarina eburnea CBS 473.64]|uniref:Rhodopsin domain-containing protein n=1 Tax=Massarina eburnea CBS 473.64 TaxID=1395130 RepID=A0A6A6RJV5_9PLEO|nr:hypothetical protein P280DRAFT_473719 [Massarina eburnea CBS 473.64]
MAIAASVCIPIVLIFAALRLYVRLRILRKWALDDYVFVLSVPAGIGLIAVNVALIYGGAFGYHAWEVTIGDLTKPVLERSVAIGIIQGPTTWLVKLTLFCLILTIFRPITWLRRLVFVGIVVTGVFYLYSAIYYGVACGPKGGVDRLSYLAGMAGKSCHNPTGFIQINNILQGAFNVFSDFYILFIPIPAIVKLHLPLQRKLAVLMIFLTGSAACAMSILALKYRTTIYKTQDNNYDTVALLTVTTIEISVGMIIPTLPSLATFARHVWVPIRRYFHTKYGWDWLGENPTEASGGDENELAKFRKRILPNGKTYSKSDTIDKMIFGVNAHGMEFQTTSSVAQQEHMSSENDLVAKTSSTT